MVGPRFARDVGDGFHDAHLVVAVLAVAAFQECEGVEFFEARFTDRHGSVLPSVRMKNAIDGENDEHADEETEHDHPDTLHFADG
jgi:hypothetical protein